ncbi:pilus assembly protein CpaC [[Luteovulum] sphaeroides subsp. megalophilum]|uniref:type II and III secretion system protein family protein n=1 Tax=Cereibacter sphaeroides TaxID=1063 RepID=UPI0002A21888|nr:type II and III secretion system protein family protein [Cereibacter sphaeroides]AZB64703.1 type II and III secretion system protein family protein [Cereibacter sphaeroides]AZB67364.1 type II and III secretion system protein family protein [Cereibacter sphaeroides]EKX57849.1 Type II/IV secretion system secretin RcpA/CpaC, associated with Flp pilus assembly [Rhodobacter sp. AKP1]SNT01878.1 pilus assembly protein CpaC [[Luteovulum] sphaeroides subsp. megalophilum]
MSTKDIFRAGLAVLALAAGMALTPAAAQTLRVMEGSASGALNVPMNRAVVVESDRPFAELSIANPGIADISTLSETSIYVLGKAPGRTTLTLLGADGRLISNVDVHVTPDVAEFKERLRQILPGENIEVRTANDGIVLSGTVTSTAKLDRALDLASRYAPDRVSNLMSVGGTQQVMLKVRFAEMQRSVAKSLGSSIYARNGSGSVIGGTGTLLQNGIPPSGAPIATSGNGALSLGFSVGALEFQVLLEALESKGVVRTLAEPNLTALSGQEAKFLAGGEYPIPVASGDEKISIEYKPFGVELNFTPVVVDGNQINLMINAAVSSIDNTVTLESSGFTINAFKRRETSTTVEMRDGESFAIAGLLQDDFRNLNGQVPWLGDIPILGALFRSAEYQRSQSELVIIVTPHLVTPTRGEALALPTDRVKLPSEKDLFLFGRVTGRGAAAEVARQDFSGSYGYVME